MHKYNFFMSYFIVEFLAAVYKRHYVISLRWYIAVADAFKVALAAHYAFAKGISQHNIASGQPIGLASELAGIAVYRRFNLSYCPGRNGLEPPCKQILHLISSGQNCKFGKC